MPKILHHFFSNQGGVSSGRYQSLNTNKKSGDSPQNVAKNYEIIAARFGLKPENFALLNQVHGNRAIFTSQPLNNTIDADGMVTKTPNLLLGITTADCCPVLLFDEKNHIIGALHAGWKSALHGIIKNTVELMRQHGAEEITALTGPSMLKPSFECQKDMRDQYLAVAPEYAEYFTPKDPAHFLYDSQAFVIDRLKEAGIKSIEPTSIDTYSNPAYFSYRRHCHEQNNRIKSDFGCQLSTIVLKD